MCLSVLILCIFLNVIVVGFLNQRDMGLIVFSIVILVLYRIGQIILIICRNAQPQMTLSILAIFDVTNWYLLFARILTTESPNIDDIMTFHSIQCLLITIEAIPLWMIGIALMILDFTISRLVLGFIGFIWIARFLDHHRTSLRKANTEKARNVSEKIRDESHP